MNRITVLMFLSAAAVGISCSPSAEHPYRIVPEPQRIHAEGRGHFELKSSTVISYQDTSLSEEALFLAQFIQEEAGLSLETEMKAPEKGDISLGIDPNLKSEGYLLKIKKDGIDIIGGTSAGVFYGTQTLRKCMAYDRTLPVAEIEDWPAFAYRGAHFDVSRHFFTVENVKTYIDMMALHNMNKLHWHITDDQGWRLEIKKYPELTKIGSIRKETVIGHLSDEPRKFDHKPYGGFYTQDEIRDIVRYAADRHIEVIPEVDLPGHMQAALASYPELGCTGGPYEVWTIWGISDDVLCAGNPKIYEFLDNVFAEVLELFPSEYIHIGGDECPKVRWAHCPKCQALEKRLGLTDGDGHTKEQKLQSYVMKHVSDFLMERGRKVIGWDEMLEGGAAPGSVIMSWRGEAGGIAAAKSGHDAVMTPNSYLYLDYYQSRDIKDEPIGIGGYVPVEKVYSYNPIPEGLNEDEARHIIGVQANLWTEYIETFSHVQYMVLPRWAALSEIQWRNPEDKDYNRFLDDLIPMISIYDKNGYNYAKHVFNIMAIIKPDMENHTVKVTLSSAGEPEIRYTLDGSEPDKNALLYDGPIVISENVELKAVAYHDGKPGKVFEQEILFNKATAQSVKLVTNPDVNYTFDGGPLLVDGIRGGAGFNSGFWLGYGHHTPFDAIVDLGKPERISSVGLGVCICTGDGIFDAKNMKVSVSDDGENFRELASATFEQVTSETNRTLTHTLNFDPTETRYVRVYAESEGDVPAWNGLHGTDAWLFVDEISID